MRTNDEGSAANPFFRDGSLSRSAPASRSRHERRFLRVRLGGGQSAGIVINNVTYLDAAAGTTPASSAVPANTTDLLH